MHTYVTPRRALLEKSVYSYSPPLLASQLTFLLCLLPSSLFYSACFPAHVSTLLASQLTFLLYLLSSSLFLPTYLPAYLPTCLPTYFAQVYLEKILKGDKTSIWVRNVQLCLFSIPLQLFAIYQRDYDKARHSPSSLNCATAHTRLTAPQPTPQTAPPTPRPHPTPPRPTSAHPR